MRRLSRFFVLVLAVAVGAASLVDCLPTAESMTASEMACCAAMDHECGAAGMPGMDVGCCPPTAGRDVDQVAASIVAKVNLAPALTAVPAPAWTLPPSPQTIVSAFAALDREILKLPERPTYLLVSAFLI